MFSEGEQVVSHVHFLDVGRVVLDLDEFLNEFSVLELNFDVISDRWEGFFAFDWLFSFSVQGFASLDLEELLIEVFLGELVLKGEFIEHVGI